MGRYVNDMEQVSRRGLARLLNLVAVVAMLAVAACGTRDLPPAPQVIDNDAAVVQEEYRLGPLDSISINVWQAPEFSTGAVIRPDGVITVPLLEEVPVAGMTALEVARDLEERLAQFIQEPIVTVTVNSFGGPFDRRIRVLREASGVQIVSFRDGMTLLDAMTEVGGVQPFDAGNRATLYRREVDGVKAYSLRLDDLIKDGDLIGANVPMRPGDTIYIPESWF